MHQKNSELRKSEKKVKAYLFLKESMVLEMMHMGKGRTLAPFISGYNKIYIHIHKTKKSVESMLKLGELEIPVFDRFIHIWKLELEFQEKY